MGSLLGNHGVSGNHNMIEWREGLFQVARGCNCVLELNGVRASRGSTSQQPTPRTPNARRWYVLMCSMHAMQSMLLIQGCVCMLYVHSGVYGHDALAAAFVGKVACALQGAPVCANPGVDDGDKCIIRRPAAACMIDYGRPART